jgi:hypothetical protein
MAIVAQNVMDRMRWNIGGEIRDWSDDSLLNGKATTEVKGIATTFSPNLDTLRRGVATGKNMFIVREGPYWTNPPGKGSGQPNQAQLDASATYRAKRDFIEANSLVVVRLRENWQNRAPDGQLVGFAKALGWQQYYKPIAGVRPWVRDNNLFQPPSATLRAMAQHVKASLGVSGLRVAGDPNQRVTKVALWHGLGGIPEARRFFDQPGVDLIIMGEPTWEFYPGAYAFDAQTLGMKRPIIFTGHQASEEPGSGEVAAWLRTFITEVPVEWMPAREPAHFIG